ncbi:MAG: hypothetical protein JW810_04335, partial [Sedimentisphaerales bacterium]|nr:hypothetical protein [Sedimentisphaerales bacterium]
MKLSEMCKGVGPWLASEGPHGDVVVSSRIRLARNVAGFHFYSHANPEQQKEILEFVHERLMRTPLKKDLWYISMSDTSAMERRLLTERHLISRELAEPDGSRAVALSRDESLVLMINEEDHLRIQIMAQGLQLMPIFTRICEIDDILESQLEYAFSAQLGYLTACPTNVGTGIRVSVMLHLPGLKMTNQIEKVFRAAK